MAEEENGNKYVTWNKFWASIVPVVVIVVGISWALNRSHANVSAHEGAVKYRELEQLREDLQEWKSDMKEDMYNNKIELHNDIVQAKEDLKHEINIIQKEIETLYGSK